VSNTLKLWTVYEHPRDYPTKYVARCTEIGDGQPWVHEEALVADTLDELRAQLPPGLHRLPRDEADAPVIVEVWL
jgi:hypothetical protein